MKRYILAVGLCVFACGSEIKKYPNPPECTDCTCETCECDLEGNCECEACACVHLPPDLERGGSTSGRPDNDGNSGGGGSCGGGSC